jgi:hypothetical protein
VGGDEGDGCEDGREEIHFRGLEIELRMKMLRLYEKWGDSEIYLSLRWC